MKKSIGFVVVTYMVMGQKYMGKLQKYCDARIRLRRVKGQWSEVFLSERQRVFFLSESFDKHTSCFLIFPSCCFIYIYMFWFYGLFGFIGDTRHLLKTAYARKGYQGIPRSSFRLRFRFPPLDSSAMRCVAGLRWLCVPGLVRWSGGSLVPWCLDRTGSRTKADSSEGGPWVAMGWLGMKKTANGNALHPNKFPPFSRNELLFLYVKSIWSCL